MSKLQIGIDDFKNFIDGGGYFSDKLLLIREVIEGNKENLLPMPSSIWQYPEHDYVQGIFKKG